jgi:acyl-coenzyme A thioesterase PaaI-like protein
VDLIDEGMCFICGKKNPIGLKAEFDIDRENLRLTGHFTPRREHEGYKGIMHGGLASALLDEAMVKLLWEAGIPAVSASLNVRLLKPVPIGAELTISGWVVSDKGRIIQTSAELRDASGGLLARADGKCVRVRSKEDGIERQDRQEGQDDSVR